MPATYSRSLLTASALLLATMGVACTFLPEELLQSLHAIATREVTLIVQMFGALCLGFGFMNWVSRGATFGGIYGRPLVIGNLMHFVTAGFALTRTVLGEGLGAFWWVMLGAYVVFSVGYALLLFIQPARAEP